jgi:hypothetical protein
VGLALMVKYVYLACKYNTSSYVKAVRSDLMLCWNYFATLREEHIFSTTSIPD